jgi:TonB-dependent SusC/RagA subfamily outer membrane receptor
MNKTIYVIVIAFFTILQTTAQDFTKKWKEVYELELEGKTKTAFEKVTEIHNASLRQKNDIQQVKSFIYLSKFKKTLVENSETTFFTEIENEINKSSEIGKAFLYQYYASKLSEYYDDDYQIKYRAKMTDRNSKDFSIWDAEKFESEIQANFEKSYANQTLLSTLKVVDFSELITQVDSYFLDKNKTLFQFFIENHIKGIEEAEYYRNYSNIQFNESFFSDSKHYIDLNLDFIKRNEIRKIGELYQILEKIALGNPSIYTLNRIKYFNNKCENSNETRLHLEKCNTYFKDSNLSNELEFIYVGNLVSSADKKTGKDNNTKALSILNRLLSDKSNPKIYRNAFNLKETILAKDLNVQMKKEVYPNENLRAFVSYKNIDTLAISYYRINLKDENLFRTDSLVLEYMNHHKAEKSYFKVVPKKEDYFDYSTEIILEPFESGNYLVVVGTPKNNGNYSFSYNILKCNSLDYFNDAKNGVENFQFRDRKTGKPIPNVIIRTNEKAYLADQYGRFSIRQTTERYPITLIHEKDTVSTVLSYNQGYYRNASYNNFTSKANVYFDRAIYRPGQKMFYKGILIQEKDYKTSIVPFVTVKLEIRNSDGTTIKTLEVQTNEFGSFSGEFDFPINGLTGSYYINIEEPDNYEKDSKYYDEKEDEHSFWDEVDFESDNFYFNVEEYKRPTFEVKMDKITTEWKLGDTILLKGKATGLAGNTISEATVIAEIDYNIAEDINPKTPTYYDDFETKTNTDGTFEIKIDTKKLNIPDSVFHIYYGIRIEVIDINGETHSVKQEIAISNELFYLKIDSKYQVLKEDKKEVKISAKTYNEVEKHVVGKLNIYKTASNKNIFYRQFGKPEIEAIDSLSFVKLFPLETYNKNTEPKRELVKTINFDTKTNSVINLDFLDIGNYTIEAISFDENKNKIDVTRNLNIDTKLPYKPSDKLFKYFTTTYEKTNQVEVILKSKIDNLFVTCFEYDEKGNIAFEHFIQLENGEGSILLQKPKNRLGLYFYAFYEDHFYSDNHIQFYNSEENRLKFEIISMRNKIEPGSTENWQFKVLNSKLESEILASMYDTSLDDFAKLNWDLYEKTRTFIDFPYFSKSNYNSITFNYYDIETKKINFNFNTTNELKDFLYDDIKNNLKQLKQKKLKDIIIGNIQAKDEIPTEIYIKNLNSNKDSQADFYGNFSIEGKLNDILLIDIHYQEFKTKVTNTKNLNLKLNIETKPEVATQSEFIIITSRYLPLKSKSVKINNKNIFYETYSVYIDTADSGIEQIQEYFQVSEKGSDGIETVQIVGAMGIKRTKDAVVSTSYTIMSNKELTQSTNPNAIQALAGRVSGLQITGEGNNQKIVLRGSRSITGDNQALVVIDGAVSSAAVLSQLPPELIDSMNVLKGSEGAALYGAQGVNGVIVVTTKKAIQELTNVKTRKNFNETAFFFPNIKTDDSGKFILEFTAPESLTRWRLNLLAHNKNGESGVFSKEIIAQKDLMLIPNMPRFVRENDELIVTAKVSNLLSEAKTGIAKLSLFDAGTGNPIDALVESKEIQNFNCKAKGSTTVQWKIKIPKDIQGLQYKIVAKAGNFTDGEENILPVLKNAVLITESQPVWLKAKDSKTITFEALTNNSETKENHKISINLVTNPIWSAIESLPYLMEYEHDCAEQTFSKLFANSISDKIINQNPKIKILLENWKQNPTSKLKMNEDLKSVLLSETPWLVENNDELQKRISALLDVAKLKTTNEVLFHKLKEKQSANGGFSWFGVGNENEYITRHILSGIGHLTKLNPENETKFKDIVSKGITYLDSKFETSKTNRVATTDLHYLYARSFFLKEHPLTKKQDSIVKLQLVDYKKNWLQQSLYEKTVLALVLHRLDDKNFAKKIIEHLRESTILDETKGMFWKENTNGYYWHQSNIELQALLIEAFSEIDYRTNEIEAMKVWLINNKQNKNWDTTKSTALAINAIISYGKDWINSESKIQINDGKNKVIQQQLNSKLKETENGLINLEIDKEQIAKNLTEIKLENNGITPVYGGVYYQYFENLDKIAATTNVDYSISKELLKDDKLVYTTDLKVGDLITIRLTFKTEKDLEFVHVKDLRASCFEPINVISETKWIKNTYYYMCTKDVASHFFFDNLPKGTYVLEYQVRVNNEGIFSDGFANLQSMYAPEFSAHSKSGTIKTRK